MSSLLSGEAFRVLQLKAPVVNKLRTKIPGAELGLEHIAITNTYCVDKYIILIYCVFVCCASLSH